MLYRSIPDRAELVVGVLADGLLALLIGPWQLFNVKVRVHVYRPLSTSVVDRLHTWLRIDHQICMGRLSLFNFGSRVKHLNLVDVLAGCDLNFVSCKLLHDFCVDLML